MPPLEALDKAKGETIYTIEKQQSKLENFKFNSYYFQRARDSFEALLKGVLAERKVLLPAYIGYSSNEGSGIFDPIKNAGSAYEFYRLTDTLDIDVESLFRLMDANENTILLLVHYFGFVDKNITRIKEYARQKGMTIIEDCAHAFFTFFQKPLIDSDYYIFSLHKMFAYDKGGMLLAKEPLALQDELSINPFKYNHYAIAQQRVQNYNYLLEKLSCFEDIKILRAQLHDNIPQTLPILLESEAVRDELYFKLNELGFGVVSLYHELIQEVQEKEHREEFYLSKHILNLPIHQDVTCKDIDRMIETIQNKNLLKCFP